MGTRSLTRIYSRYTKPDGERVEKPGIVMYRQYDGYAEGHGRALAEFCKDLKIVNGISSRETAPRIANGSQCFAAQMITHFKTKEGRRRCSVGNIYLHPPLPSEDSEYHDYKVFIEDCHEGEEAIYPILQLSEDGKVVFEGSGEQFLNEYLPSLNKEGDEGED